MKKVCFSMALNGMSSKMLLSAWPKWFVAKPLFSELTVMEHHSECYFYHVWNVSWQQNSILAYPERVDMFASARFCMTGICCGQNY
jgi:hypothetical protein